MGHPPPLHPDTFTEMNTVALHILLECDLCPQRCASSVGEPSRPSPAASPPAGPGLESRPRPHALQPSSLSSQPSSSARGLCGTPGPPPAPAAHARSAAARPTGHRPRRPPRPAPFSEPHGFLQPLRLRVLSIQHSRPRGHGQMPPAVLQHPSSPPPVTTDPPRHPVCQGRGHLDSRVCFTGSCGHATESGQWNEPSPAQCSLRPSLGDNASEVRSLMPPSWAVI